MTFRPASGAALQRAAATIPSLCAVCRGWGLQRVCADCVARYAPAALRCRRCALRVPQGVAVCGACLVDPPPFARAVAALDYTHPWDALIAQFKFHEALELAPALAQRLVEALDAGDASVPTGASATVDGPPPAARPGDGPLAPRGSAGPAAPTAPTAAAGAVPSAVPDAAATTLLPVPLSPQRLRERGYNQAWELARRVARARGCGADAGLLLRVRDTAHQLALPPARRAGNVHRAFAVAPQRRDELRGRHYTLVDDVMTTGATLAEASRTLLAAGAAAVDVWVVARTPAHADR